jgi:hypothetical protein
MVALTLDGNEGDGAEQNFPKVHGSRLGWYSGDISTYCRRAMEQNLPRQLLSNLYQYDPRVYRPWGIYRIVTAESEFCTVLVVVPGYTTCPHIQLRNIGLGGQCCDDIPELLLSSFYNLFWVLLNQNFRSIILKFYRCGLKSATVCLGLHLKSPCFWDRGVKILWAPT